MPPDLVQAYLFLVAARKAGRKFFAFYNCKRNYCTTYAAFAHEHTGGDLSGASQPHKHLQLIPVEDDGPPIEHLARGVKLEQEGTLPYIYPHDPLSDLRP